MTITAYPDTIPVAGSPWPRPAATVVHAEPEPAWLQAARRDIGLREIPGAPTAPTIARWLQQLGAWWGDDETPWCGTACAAWMRAAGITPPAAWYRARAWAAWGSPLAGPLVGAVAVLDGGPSRPGAGHVGLVVGLDAAGRLILLGGNQGDAVGYTPFARHRVLAYRWPQGVAVSLRTLPLLSLDAPTSTREA